MITRKKNKINKKHTNAKKVVFDGIAFDSKQECDRYLWLRNLESIGKIQNLELKPEFELCPHFKVGKYSFDSMNYTPDFKYIKDGDIIIEEFKGRKTEPYRMRRKLFVYKFVLNGDFVFKEVSVSGKRYNTKTWSKNKK